MGEAVILGQSADVVCIQSNVRQLMEKLGDQIEQASGFVDGVLLTRMSSDPHCIIIAGFKSRKHAREFMLEASSSIIDYNYDVDIETDRLGMSDETRRTVRKELQKEFGFSR